MPLTRWRTGRTAGSMVTTEVIARLLPSAPIETPKLGGRWYYAVILYALVLSGVYGWQLP